MEKYLIIAAIALFLALRIRKISKLGWSDACEGWGEDFRHIVETPAAFAIQMTGMMVVIALCGLIGWYKLGAVFMLMYGLALAIGIWNYVPTRP